MSISTITQNGYELSCDIDELPSQFSSSIEFEFIQDEKYAGYVPTAYYKYLSNHFIESGMNSSTYAVAVDANKRFRLPLDAFLNDGYIAVAFSLSNEYETIQTKPIIYKIWSSVGGTNILPDDTKTWEIVVFDAVKNYVAIEIGKTLVDLGNEAIVQQTKAEQQQSKATALQDEATRQQQVAKEQQDRAEQQQQTAVQEQEKTASLQTTVDNKLIELNELEKAIDSNETMRQFAEETRQNNTTAAIDSCNEIVSQIQGMLESGELDGEDCTIEIGSVTKGDAPSIVNVGTVNHAVFDIVLPKGDKGEIPTLEFGNVKTGTPKVEVKESASGYILDITLPAAGDLSGYYDRDEIDTKFSEKIILEEKDGGFKNLNLKFTVTDELVIPNNEEIKVSPNMGIKITNKN